MMTTTEKQDHHDNTPDLASLREALATATAARHAMTHALEVMTADANRMFNALDVADNALIIADEYLPDEGAMASSWTDARLTIAAALAAHAAALREIGVSDEN